LVVDRFINTGAGLGGDFGRKLLKSIAVEASGEIKIEKGTDAFQEVSEAYIRRQKTTFCGEIRRSCLGCVQGCGLYRAKEGVAFFADEIERLQALLPHWTRDQVNDFYQEGLRQGMKFCRLGEPVSRKFPGENLREFMEHWTCNCHDHPEGCSNTRSWEEVQLNVHHWYRDEAFRRVETVEDLIEKENLAMVKNCLPCCELWSMGLEEMSDFLKWVGPWTYSPQELLSLGERIIRQTMSFYQGINYGGIDELGHRPSSLFLPAVLREHPRDYLRLRGLVETGYPPKE